MSPPKIPSRQHVSGTIEYAKRFNILTMATSTTASCMIGFGHMLGIGWITTPLGLALGLGSKVTHQKVLHNYLGKKVKSTATGLNWALGGQVFASALTTLQSFSALPDLLQNSQAAPFVGPLIAVVAPHAGCIVAVSTSLMPQIATWTERQSTLKKSLLIAGSVLSMGVLATFAANKLHHHHHTHETHDHSNHVTTDDVPAGGPLQIIVYTSGGPEAIGEQDILHQFHGSGIIHFQNSSLDFSKTSGVFKAMDTTTADPDDILVQLDNQMTCGVLMIYVSDKISILPEKDQSLTLRLENRPSR